MKCPACKDIALVMADRNGIEIDYCPTCRGVWLDRGELDKIIERAAPTMTAAPQHQPQPQPQYQPQPQSRPHPGSSHGHDPRHGDDRDYYKNKKRKGFLGELFDFD